jgi:uncharacterized protein
MNIPNQITQELGLRKDQVNSVLNLLAEGSTIPFIARYRKEQTGGLDEDQLRTIEDRLTYLNMLEERKAVVLNSIEEQGKLTDELKSKIENSLRLQEVEDLYLPFKPKRKTRGTVAKAKGLEPLALHLLDNYNDTTTLEELASAYINEELGVLTVEDAIKGASDIIAEMVSENAEVRKTVRDYVSSEALIKVEKSSDAPEVSEKNLKLRAKGEQDVYRTYYDFQIDISKIKPYQIMALDRGEREKFLKVHFTVEPTAAHSKINESFFKDKKGSFDHFFEAVVEDSFKRLIFPSIDREVRNELVYEAGLHAIEVFAENLHNVLLQPPLLDRVIMGLDPGFASGTKVAIIDETGKYIDGVTIYPHPPQNRIAEAEKVVVALINKYKVDVVAIGNGTASRETETFVSELIKKNSLEAKYIIVNEAGASVYSASEVAKKEFPDLEASQRGNISIARRLLDPLSELVKIDPKSIGVGQYQHDVDQKLLAKKLVVVSCVNYVGVDLNTASSSLLTYVSGLNKRLADSIVKHRESKGKFKKRSELLGVRGVGEKVYEQCAGFLKIPDGDEPLDSTFIHPESYETTNRLLEMVNIKPSEIKETGGAISFYINKISLKKVASELNVGEMTLQDIIENIKKPGRDPREELPPPILRSDIMKMEDLRPGMKVKGTVRNVVDFGAFIDIGVKQDGLLHISKMKQGFVKNPSEVVAAGDILEVTITEVDLDRKRISLSLVD